MCSSDLSTKEKILNAAIQLLENTGIKGLTQPAVAKLVGIPQGQLTYHFKHRADLVLAVTEMAMDGVAEYLWKNHPELASRSFSKLIGLVLEMIKSKTQVRALIGLIVEADDSPEVYAKLMQQGTKVRSLIAEALQLQDDEPEVTVAHSVILGFAIMLFLQRDKQQSKLLEVHFQVAVGILEKHLKEKKPVKKNRPRKKGGK